MISIARWIALGICVLLFAALLYSGFQEAGPHPLLGQPAPPVELALLDGGRMDLAIHRGKEIVILDFWATWCPPCREGMPVLEEIAKDYGDRGIVLYAVNQGESPGEIRSYLESEGLDSVVALDYGYQAARPYEVSGIPQTVIIDKDGIVQAVYVGFGPGTGTLIRRDLDQLLAGRSLVSMDDSE